MYVRTQQKLKPPLETGAFGGVQHERLVRTAVQRTRQQPARRHAELSVLHVESGVLRGSLGRSTLLRGLESGDC